MTSNNADLARITREGVPKFENSVFDMKYAEKTVSLGANK